MIVGRSAPRFTCGVDDADSRPQSRALEYAGKRLQVARVPGSLSERPIFGSPEEVRVQRRIRLSGPSHALVVVLNYLLWRAAVHRHVVGIWRSGHGLPRFRWALR